MTKSATRKAAGDLVQLLDAVNSFVTAHADKFDEFGIPTRKELSKLQLAVGITKAHLLEVTAHLTQK